MNEVRSNEYQSIRMALESGFASMRMNFEEELEEALASRTAQLDKVRGQAENFIQTISSLLDLE